MILKLIIHLLLNIILIPSMYFESDQTPIKADNSIKTVYIYENSCNNRQPIEYRIRVQNNVFKDIARIMKFKKIRLFNQEGAQYFQDDIEFIKNKTSLYVSRGEQFDPHNCYSEYQMVHELGEGGFGKVFLARHKHTGDKYAIKIIKISAASDIDSIFVEAEILKSLKHDNIVKVTNCLTLKNMQVAIIMEYLQGGELLKYVQKQGRLDEETCKIFLRQIVKGIMYCHQNNLIHRDLKLENIVLVNSEEKKIKIIDFGIAGIMNRLTQQDLDAGSLGYMAPECFLTYNPNNNDSNFKFDGRMDVWAIGVILFGMLCAQLPFKGSNHHEIKQNIKKVQYQIPLEVRRSISNQCLNVIFRCLDPNPKTRIKINELLIHQWFSKVSKEQEKALQNINYPNEQNTSTKQTNDKTFEIQKKPERSTFKEKTIFLNPINQIEQNTKNKRENETKSLNKAKDKIGSFHSRPPMTSNYKNKFGNSLRIGKQNLKNRPN